MIICHLYHLRNWTYGICQHLLTGCAADCTVDPIQTCLLSFGWLALFLSRMTRFISAVPVFPFEWQLLTFQTSVNWRVQLKKHTVSPPVTGYPQHFYPCLSWGSIQPPQDLLRYLLLHISLRNSTLSSLFFLLLRSCKGCILSSAYRKAYLLKSISSLTYFSVQIY